ncbi:hypothetical protein [Stenotrophomonas rhizophila]|uniref:hypothetical protein n=1 Tax=Stenotrophomonas rhizophila TaxID=216778 RepID=UPI001E47B6F2|nr:hypothetical protein [Stenotrophomonas rhizophila]MCC7633788.1 hypothetical protein [Stenotrophomonas rhizophila]MCC7663734.1 hypothetical protein [Stenotrophomonas rhizophila]
MNNTFGWICFPEGRARFGGGVRGWDELGHETFALELRGREYFGEIKRVYLENHNDFNIVIDSFGYRSERDVSMPGTDVREVFSSAEEITARVMIVQLIQAGLKFETPPSRLRQTETSHFMGEVIFSEGWMLVRAVDGRRT